MKTFWLAACLSLFTAPVQEIVITPPQDDSGFEITYPEGWQEEEFEPLYSAGKQWKGIRLTFTDEHGDEQEVLIFIKEEGEAD
jgi:hypothetical protein